MIRDFVWWVLLVIAVAVFVFGIGVAVSGNIIAGIVILLADLGYMELINPNRRF